MNKKKILFISWSTAPNSRNESIAHFMNADAIYIGKRKQNKFYSLLSYFRKIINTFHVIFSLRPHILIVTNNIWLLPFTAVICCRILNIKLILDTHSDPFSKTRWRFISYPIFIHKVFARFAEFSLVTNINHKRIVESWGATAIVFPDPPINLLSEKMVFFNLKQGKRIAFVCTYSSDEPYEEAIKAFKDLSDITFYVTGNYNGRKIVTQFENIIHTGFLSRANYLYLLNNVDAILTLTTREDTMQCAGNEAVSLEKPLILSDTKFLREQFQKSCIYVMPERESIKAGIINVFKNYATYRNEIADLKTELERKALSTIMMLNNKLNIHQ